MIKSPWCFHWLSPDRLSLADLLLAKKGKSLLFLLGSSCCRGESTPSGLLSLFNWGFCLLLSYTLYLGWPKIHSGFWIFQYFKPNTILFSVPLKILKIWTNRLSNFNTSVFHFLSQLWILVISLSFIIYLQLNLYLISFFTDDEMLVLSCIWLFSNPWTSPLGPCVYGFFQARILEWGPISFSRRSSWPRDWTQVSCVSCNFRWVLDHVYTITS